MSATSLDLSQIKTDALLAASSFRTLIGLGTGNTPTFLGATLTGGTVTASAPLVDATQTWNSAATVFTGVRFNVTDTASSASSLLMDLQVGGSSRLNIQKSGYTKITATTSGYTPALWVSDQNNTLGGAFYFEWRGGAVNRKVFAMTADSDGLSFWRLSDGGASFVARSFGAGQDGNLFVAAADCRLYRDTANVLAIRNDANAQTFRIYNTFTDASNYERGKLEWSSNVFRIGTEKAGTGSARTLELQTDGTTRLTIGTAGLFTIADALNVAVGATIGTKIGTATTQKLGFFNAAPVVQPTAVADATDAASVITQLNALLTRMRNLGLIAT